MKKLLISISVVILIAIILIYNIGIEIGRVRIGKKAIVDIEERFDFNASLFNKNYYSSSNLIVVNFWATWCKPCISEFDSLNLLKNTFKQDSVFFLSLSMDRDTSKLQKFLKTSKFKFEDITIKNIAYRTSIFNVLEERNQNTAVDNYSLPKTFVIKNKKIMFEYDGVVDYNELKNIITKYK